MRLGMTPRDSEKSPEIAMTPRSQKNLIKDDAIPKDTKLNMKLNLQALKSEEIIPLLKLPTISTSRSENKIIPRVYEPRLTRSQSKRPTLGDKIDKISRNFSYESFEKTKRTHKLAMRKITTKDLKYFMDFRNDTPIYHPITSRY